MPYEGLPLAYYKKLVNFPISNTRVVQTAVSVYHIIY